ncbi:MAG: two pore domain potassium channel family protein, partial [bacterium]|nr:two pore domain potassium channel family protein [bacterium]
GPMILGGLFIGFLIWRILKDVLTGPRITQERVFGAVCAYLLIGFLFADIYGFIALVDDKAFAVSDNIRQSWAEGDASGVRGILTYFSFVTMTTLGYGDISPVSQSARTLAWIQALVGQLYLAITIAGLVGMHIANKDE